MTDLEIKQINSYFREFILFSNYYKYAFINQSENQPEYETLIFIKKNQDIPFHKKWEYMMVLVLAMEDQFDFYNIETHDNYVRFKFNRNDAMQDKGSNKLQAFYGCCFGTLEKLWKEKKPPFEFDSGDSFLLDDF